MRRRAIGSAAAAGGAAYYAAKRGASASEEEQAREADQEVPPDPAADPVEQLKELAELREQGILTDEEFAAEKKKLLGS
jgi:hypothetical protein